MDWNSDLSRSGPRPIWFVLGGGAVALAIGAVIVSVLGASHGARDHEEREQAIEAELAALDARHGAKPAAPGPDEVVSWALRLGEQSAVVDRDTFELPGGRTLELEPVDPQHHVYVSDGEAGWPGGRVLSFDHGPTTEVALRDDDDTPELEIATSDGAIVRVQPLDQRGPDLVEQLADRLAARFGLSRTPATPRREIAGSEREGVGFVTRRDRMRIDLYVLPFGSSGSVAVSVFQREGAPIAEVDRVLRTLADARLPPTAPFVAVVRDSEGAELSRTPLLPEQLAPVPLGEFESMEVVLTRLNVVRRRFRGVELEHDADLAVAVDGDGSLPRLVLTRDDVALQVVVHDDLLPQDVRTALLTGFPGAVAVPVMRPVAGGPLEGTRVETAVGSDLVVTEVYGTRVGGRTVGLVLQFRADAENEAVARFASVAGTLR